jgi:hypothetical protein
MPNQINPNQFSPAFIEGNGLTGPVPSMVPNGSAALYLAVADGAGVALAAVSANALAQTPPNNPAPAIWAFGEDDSGVKGVSLRSDGVVGATASILPSMIMPWVSTAPAESMPESLMGTCRSTVVQLSQGL